MDKPDVIDLCSVKSVKSIKSEKSVDTSTTIPLDEYAENLDQTIPFDMPEKESHAMPPGALEDEELVKRNLTEQWVRDQIVTVPPLDNSLNQEGQLGDLPLPNVVETPDSAHLMNVAVIVPTEITELVNKECVIKLINFLVIYAINKVTEADLRRKLLSVTPDIDPQINYRSTIGFQCVYERCAVLFYEALLDLIEIMQHFDASLKEIVLLWMYKTVESICKAHDVDGSFLRNDKFIETLLRDFAISQAGVPDPGNIFFNIYQKMQPTVIDTLPVQNHQANAAGPSAKKPRKPRTKKAAAKST